MSAAQVMAIPVAILYGHTSDITWVEFCGRMLASCSSDKTVRLWNVTNPEERVVELNHSPLLGHRYTVHCCYFSPLGSTLATCSTDGYIYLWDVKTGERISELANPSRLGIRVCSFSSNSHLLASGGEDDTIILWDVASKSIMKTYNGHEGTVTCLSFSNDDGYIMSGSTNCDLKLWDARYTHTRALLTQSEAHDLGVTGCTFSPTNASSEDTSDRVGTTYIVATCGNDNEVRIWRVNTSPSCSLVLKFTLSGHSANVMHCRFIPDGTMLASASGDKTVIFWDAINGTALRTFERHSRYVTSCAFTSDASLMATGSNDKTIIIWKLLFNAAAENEDATGVQNVTLAASVDVTKQVPQWSSEDVSEWLNSLQLQQYTPQFLSQGVNGKQLRELNPTVLKKNLGIEAKEDQERIMKGVQAICFNTITNRELQKEDPTLPEEFFCPITHELMQDPVIASDGFTYERRAIKEWFNSGKDTSPLTNTKLVHTALTPNHTLKMLIQRHQHKKSS